MMVMTMTIVMTMTMNGADDDDDGDDIHEHVMTIAGKYFALYRSRGLSEGKRKESLFIPRHPTMAL